MSEDLLMTSKRLQGRLMLKEITDLRTEYIEKSHEYISKCNKWNLNRQISKLERLTLFCYTELLLIESRSTLLRLRIANEIITKKKQIAEVLIQRLLEGFEEFTKRCINSSHMKPFHKNNGFLRCATKAQLIVHAKKVFSVENADPVIRASDFLYRGCEVFVNGTLLSAVAEQGFISD
eukprot:TRINITY_DN4766_c0_g2_i1.p1 TRINITY_DN4766_c0_g2~~TRINITY_DN4766_c0_g2_i1.p1  ORF type:complete len:178 (-),score=10.20 TRINITY_DN4766_c0_g2_i1:129-662(-)